MDIALQLVNNTGVALKSRVGEVRPLQEWHALAREMSPEWTG